MVKVGRDPLIVARWLESRTDKPLTEGSTSASPASPFVFVQLRFRLPAPDTANPQLVRGRGTQQLVAAGCGCFDKTDREKEVTG